MSMKPVTVGEIMAGPGQTARGFLATDVGRGVTVRMPVVVINGTADGPVFAVTAGVHGAEYPGIEAAIRLSRMLQPTERLRFPLEPPQHFPARRGSHR